MIAIAQFEVDDTKARLDYSPADRIVLLTIVGPSGGGKQVRIDVGELVRFPAELVTVADLMVDDGQ